MCLIFDTNRFSDAFAVPCGGVYEPILKWLLDGEGVVVFGGTQYRAEIRRHSAAVRFFAQLSRAGRAQEVDDEKVDAETAALTQCCSNDAHIIALARVSGARTICTDDAALMKDAKNKSLLDKPRGRIYRKRNHVHLLQHDAGCRRPSRKSK